MFFNPSVPSIDLYPTTISKVNTLLQLVLMGCTLAFPVFIPADLSSQKEMGQMILTGLHFIVSLTTISSGISYLIRNDTIKFIRFKRKHKRI
jgi:cardiolipin synthase